MQLKRGNKFSWRAVLDTGLLGHHLKMPCYVNFDHVVMHVHVCDSRCCVYMYVAMVAGPPLVCIHTAQHCELGQYTICEDVYNGEGGSQFLV